MWIVSCRRCRRSAYASSPRTTTRMMRFPRSSGSRAVAQAADRLAATGGGPKAPEPQTPRWGLQLAAVDKLDGRVQVGAYRDAAASTSTIRYVDHGHDKQPW